MDGPVAAPRDRRRAQGASGRSSRPGASRSSARPSDRRGRAARSRTSRISASTAPLHLVNPKGGIVHGRPAATSCRAIGEPIDLALLLVGAGAAAGRARGRRGRGYPARGRARRRLRRDRRGRRHRPTASSSTSVAGSRSRVSDRTASASSTSSTAPPAGRACCPPRLSPGSVAIVSQSGATASEIATFASAQTIGVSLIISTGNEAMVDTIAMASAVLEDERVRAVAMFVESIRDPERLRCARRAGRRAREAVVMMKVGHQRAGRRDRVHPHGRPRRR